MKKREGEEEEEKNMTKQLLLCEKLKKWLRFLHIDIHVSHQAHTHKITHTFIQESPLQTLNDWVLLTDIVAQIGIQYVPLDVMLLTIALYRISILEDTTLNLEISRDK